MNLIWKEKASEGNFLPKFQLTLDENCAMGDLFKTYFKCEIEQYLSDSRYQRKYRLMVNGESYGVLFSNDVEEIKEKFTETVKECIELRKVFFHNLSLLIK